MELLQSALKSRDTVCAAREAGLPPLFVKIAPDLTDAELKDIAEVAVQSNVDGLIVCNTTRERYIGIRVHYFYGTFVFYVLFSLPRPQSLVGANKIEDGGKNSNIIFLLYV